VRHRVCGRDAEPAARRICQSCLDKRAIHAAARNGSITTAPSRYAERGNSTVVAAPAGTPSHVARNMCCQPDASIAAFGGVKRPRRPSPPCRHRLGECRERRRVDLRDGDPRRRHEREVRDSRRAIPSESVRDSPARASRSARSVGALPGPTVQRNFTPMRRYSAIVWVITRSASASTARHAHLVEAAIAKRRRDELDPVRTVEHAHVGQRDIRTPGSLDDLDEDVGVIEHPQSRR